MALHEPSKPTALTQELRLATTMTGGVSLAVWMAGVAREINLLAQASQWRRVGGAFPTEGRLKIDSEQSLKLYAELIELLDIVVDVDILSGTSAGGINAALLASSRVTGSDLGGLRDIWLDVGALTDLLRDPTDKSTPSLLYGDEWMFAKLVYEIPKLKKGPFPPAKFPEELGTQSTTLYVTTTLLNGETTEFTDSFGTHVQDVDRRGVFTFTEAELAKDDNASALALAARSSASFPAAFEPSFVPFSEGTAAKGKVPARPPMWPFANITRSHWVADGGLLDNQPLDVLLKCVFDRKAERRVRRVLLFVVPSAGPTPDLVQEPPPDNVDQPLELVEGLLKDLTAITKQSIAADLRAIKTHQDRMDARTHAKLRLAELATRLPGSRLLTSLLLADYMKREATKQAQDLTGALLRQLSTWPSESRGPTDNIPTGWQSELTMGGDAEKVCRQTIEDTIQNRWSQPPDRPLPAGPADLARYGQAAFDLAKGCALSVVGAAYQLAKEEDFTTLTRLTKEIHEAHEPARQTDLAQLVREVCTNKDIRRGTLENAAAKLAEAYLDKSVVPEEAWARLNDVFVDHRETLGKLAGVSTTTGAGTLTQDDDDDVAASPLATYLKYLRPRDNSQEIATKLFDLAATQRAMLPVDADIEQPLELVQVSADTRSLAAPEFRTAEQKLTGMQLHHFGAFYKRSWRANDWLWGRLDGAGWLVHVLLDPRRVLRIVQRHAGERAEGETGAQWFIRQLKGLGAPEFPVQGYQLPAAGRVPDRNLTETTLLEELGFLDDSSKPIPPSIPNTSLWLAQVWQQRVLDEELLGLASAVKDPQPGKRPDWSPTRSRTWAESVIDAVGAEAKRELFKNNPIPNETLLTDKGSPLMAHTITKAAATASAAVGSVRQVPRVVKPPLATLRTVTLGGYRVVSTTKGAPRWFILIGLGLVVLGVALAIQSVSLVGVTGLGMAGIGAYLIVVGTWQLSRRLIFALMSVTLVGLTLSLATPYVRKWLFGVENHPGLVGRNVYWLGTSPCHPLVVVLGIAAAVILLGAAKPRRK